MNSRRIIFVLVALVVALLALNTVTMVRLLCQRTEIKELHARELERKPAGQEHEDQVKSPADVSPFTVTQSASIVLGEVNQENGLRQVYDMKDGITAPASIEGVACRELTRPGELAKIHFTVDASFKKAAPMHAWLEVEYFDAAPNGVLSIEYDGPQSYTPSERRVRLKNSSEWKTNTFELTEAVFTGRENGGADFRIIATKPKVFIRRVTLKME